MRRLWRALVERLRGRLRESAAGSQPVWQRHFEEAILASRLPFFPHAQAAPTTVPPPRPPRPAAAAALAPEPSRKAVSPPTGAQRARLEAVRGLPIDPVGRGARQLHGGPRSWAAFTLAAAVLAAAELPAAVITVNTVDPGVTPADDGWCTLYEAVAAANADAPSGGLAGECAAGLADDRIVFAVATPAAYFMNFGPLVVTAGLAVSGPGAELLTLNGLGFNRIFVFAPIDILAGPTLELSGLTLTGGWAIGDYNGFGLGSGGALLSQAGAVHLHDAVVVDNLAQDQGAGIYSASELTVERCTFTSNDNLGPVLLAGGGAAISHNSGSDLTIRDSTFVDNTALANHPSGALFDPHGGAVSALSFGTVTIERSTFVGNRASGAGGAIAIGLHRTYPTALTTVLRFLTVTDNEADTDGDGIGGNPGVYTGGSAGGIFIADSPGSATIEGSIVAGNLDSGPDKAPDVDAFDLTSLGYNLIGVRRGNASSAFPAGQPNVNDDWVGSLGAPLPHGLAALSANGGPTATRLPDLAQGPSLAIDHGSCPTELVDQRGYRNPASGARAVDEPTVLDADDGCDIGAGELGAAAPDLFRDGFESADTALWSATFP